MRILSIVIIIITIIAAGALVAFKYHIERKKLHKRRVEAWYALIMDNSILAAIGAIFLLLILVLAGFNIEQEDIVDVPMLVTVAETGILGVVLIVSRSFAINKLEDSLKLSQEYDNLIKKYRAEEGWYKYDNSNADSVNLAALSKKERKEIEEDKEKDKGIIKFPVIIDCRMDNMHITINDSQKMYKLPASIRPYENELFKAHDTSHLYNQLNIRVADWHKDGNKFVINTERTTYFKSMVTNRVMDYRMKSEMTARDILQYGPFVPDLHESVLSNHLGFNGFIITSDNKLPLVKRDKDLSIAKDTYGPSVGASLKTMYCLKKDSGYTLSMEGLLAGIRKEIVDELKLELKDLEGLSEKNIIAAYRDIVEGNKPQLLFYYHVDKTSKEISDRFNEEIQKRQEDDRHQTSVEEQEVEDGKEIVWFDIDTLEKNLYTCSVIIRNGIRYKSVPSSTVSLLVLMEHLKRMNKNERNRTGKTKGV